MKRSLVAATSSPWTTRLSALGPLSDRGMTELAQLAPDMVYRPGREMIAEGEPAEPARIVLAGWAARVRYFSDGRRQLLSFLLPGDLIGVCFHPDPIVDTAIVALTEVAVAILPTATEENRLGQAYSVSGAMANAQLLRQVARLGRLNAYERLADWMLEIHDRLALAGLVDGWTFPLPLTQETLADALGLTSVHLNRTLQQMRREGAIDLRSGVAKLLQPDQLQALVDYRPIRVSRAAPGGR